MLKRCDAANRKSHIKVDAWWALFILTVNCCYKITWKGKCWQVCHCLQDRHRPPWHQGYCTNSALEMPMKQSKWTKPCPNCAVVHWATWKITRLTRLHNSAERFAQGCDYYTITALTDAALPVFYHEKASAKCIMETASSPILAWGQMSMCTESAASRRT